MNPLEVFFMTLLTAEFYKKLVSPREKKQWENKIGIHHGKMDCLQ